jgi:alpha,alpha-trehalase
MISTAHGALSMRPALLLLCAVALAGASGAATDTQPPRTEHDQPYPHPPHDLFDGLFVAVQTSGIFADGKIFVDAVPLSSPPTILEEYRVEHPEAPAALKSFVAAHFQLPTESSTATGPNAAADITAHIDTLWTELTRETVTAPRWSSLLPLPEPYVVPGGRFREIYYWDSYFTMLGLIESGRQDLARSMVADFAFLIGRYGHVPNGTRSYYLSRSQPPFFFLMVGLLDGADPPAAFARFLPQMRREYAFWMRGAAGVRAGAAHARVVGMPDGSLLNRYWDDRATPRDESYREDTELAHRSGRSGPQLFRDIRAAAESGWDFSSRWLADARSLATIDTTEIVPVDLNSLLFGLEEAIRQGCARVHNESCAREFAQRAVRRQAAIDRYLWDEASGAYFDYQLERKARVPRVTAATLYPLFVAAASENQARAVATLVRSELLRAGGIVTTTLDTGQQWDAPNGWAPLQWIAVAGFRHYGQGRLAESVACRWMASVNHVYQRRGKLVEKYDVIAPEREGGGGEYPLQDGFGWTNGVMRKLMVLYPTDAAVASADQCPKSEDVTS